MQCNPPLKFVMQAHANTEDVLTIAGQSRICSTWSTLRHYRAVKVPSNRIHISHCRIITSTVQMKLCFQLVPRRSFNTVLNAGPEPDLHSTLIVEILDAIQI